MTQLACGCIRNRVVCPDAERLWDRVADAHKAFIAAKTIFEHLDDSHAGRVYAALEERSLSFAAYEAALAEYEDHFRGPTTANQVSLL